MSEKEFNTDKAEEITNDEINNEANIDNQIVNKETENISEQETIDSQQVDIENILIEFANIKDKHIRLQAEFDNFRKRTIKEKAELIKTGGEKILSGIISVVDDLDRALIAFKDIEDENPLKQGVLLISNKFNDFLKQNGITEIDALNKEFDTDLHEALTEIPAPNDELKGKTIDVIQKGYMLYDKVIRFAKVVVGK